MIRLTQALRHGFATYESLVTQLSSAHNFKAVIDLYQSHQELFKHEHIILALRMLGRYTRGSQTQEFDNQSLLELTRKVNTIIVDLNEYDVVDILFWLRRFKQFKMQTGITIQSQNELFDKIRKMVEQQQFTFRNLVNIYYDLSYLNQSTEQLSKQLLEQLTNQTKQITPFITIQFLSSIVTKLNFCNTQSTDLQILQKIITHLETTIEDFDVEQKAQLFKHISEVQFQNISPRFQLPAILRQIKDELIQKLDQLSEESVIGIIKAYGNLPKTFDYNLLKELKDMITSTLETNSENLKSKFLLQLFEQLQLLPFNRYSPELNKQIIKELAQRIDQKQLEYYQISKICSLVMKGQKYDILVKALESKMEDFIMSVKIMDYLFINGVNVAHTVNKALEQDKKYGFLTTVHFYLYAERDLPEKAPIFLETIKQFIQTQPQYSLKQIRDSDLHIQQRYQLQEEAYLALIEMVRANPNEFNKVLRDLLNGSCSAKCRNAFIQLFSEIDQGKPIVNKVMNFFEDFTSEGLQLLIQLMNKNAAKVPLSRLVDFLSNNQQKLITLQKFDLIHQVSNLLFNVLQSKPADKQKFYPITNFINRYENLGQHPYQFQHLLKQILENYKKNNGNVAFDDYGFAQLLLSYDVLDSNLACVELQSQRYTGQLRSKLLSRALEAEVVPESLKELQTKIREQALENINATTDEKKALSLLDLIILSKDIDEASVQQLQDLIKKYSSKFSPMLYFDSVQFCRNQTLLKELALLFSTFSQKLSLSRVMQSIHKFQQKKAANPLMYNTFLEIVGNNFNYLLPEQRVAAMELLAEGRLKQTDFFKKNFEKIIKNPYHFRFHFQQIFDCGIQLGLVEEEFKQIYKQLVESNVSNNENVIIKQILYYIIADFPIEQIDKLASQVTKIKLREPYRLIHAYEYMSRAYPDSATTKLLSQLKEEKNFEKLHTQIVGSARNRPSYPSDLLKQYLKVMGVEFQENILIDQILVEFFIPANDSIVQVVNNQFFNFDRSSYTGNTLFNLKLTKSLNKNVLLFNFREFHQLQNEQRVKFLNDLGIKTQKETLDFSTIANHKHDNVESVD